MEAFNIYAINSINEANKAGGTCSLFYLDVYDLCKNELFSIYRYVILLSVFFVSAGLNHLIETKRVWKDCTLSAGGGERGIGASRTWNSLEGLPSKYSPGPMLLNFQWSNGNCSQSYKTFIGEIYESSANFLPVFKNWIL